MEAWRLTVFVDLSDVPGSEPPGAVGVGEEVFGRLVGQLEVAECHVAAAENDLT